MRKALFLTLCAAMVLLAFPQARTAHAAITQWSLFDTSGTAYDVAWANDYLYVADGTAGLKVVDASNPALLSLMGTYDTPGTAKSVAVMGNNVVVADTTGGLAVINVGTPTAPALLATYAPAGVSFVSVEVVGTTAYALSTTALYIIDLTVNDTPVLKSTLSLSTAPKSLAVRGNYAYVAKSNGMDVVDISSATAPVIAGTLAGASSGFGPYGVYLDGNYAYFSDWTMGFVVVDVTDPTAPTLVHDNTGNPNGSEYGITGFGHYVITNSSQGDASTANKAYLFDITHPTSPTLVESYQLADQPHAMVYALGVVYIAEHEAGIRALNVTNADTPTITAPTVKEKNSIIIKVSGKNKTITPFGKTFAGLYVRKINFGSLRGTVYLMASNGQRKKTPLRVYNASGNLIQALDPFSGFNGAGLNIDLKAESLTSHKNRVYVAVAAKKDGQSVRVYELTTSGLTSLSRMKIGSSTKKGNVLVKFVDPAGDHLTLITVVQGHGSTLKVWKLNPSSNTWVTDTDFSKSRIRITGSKIELKS